MPNSQELFLDKEKKDMTKSIKSENTSDQVFSLLKDQNSSQYEKDNILDRTKLKTIKKYFNPFFIQSLITISPENRKNLIQNIPLFEKIGIEVNGYNSKKLSTITRDKLMTLVKNIDLIGYFKLFIQEESIFDFSEISQESFKIIRENKEEISKFKGHSFTKIANFCSNEELFNIMMKKKKLLEEIEIDVSSIDTSSFEVVPSSEIKRIVKKRPLLEELGIKIKQNNFAKISRISNEFFDILEQYKGDIKKINRQLLLDIITLFIDKSSPAELLVEKIALFEQMGINVSLVDVDTFFWTKKENLIQLIENCNFLKENFDININETNIKDLSNIFRENIPLLEENKIFFKEIGWEITDKNIRHLSKIDKQGICLLEDQEDELKKYDNLPIDKIIKITEAGYEIKKIKDRVKILDIENLDIMDDVVYELLDNDEIGELLEISDSNLEELVKNKIRLKNKFGININLWNMKELSEVLWKNLDKLKNNEKSLKKSGVIINEETIVFLSHLNETQFQTLKKNKGKIKTKDYNYETSDMKFIFSILEEKADHSNYKNYLTKREKFLNKYQTLSDEDFFTLFSNSNKDYKLKDNLGRYGKSEIQQQLMGYCFAYSVFEELKKRNSFNVLIKTSMSSFDGGWKVKIPLGDPNGKEVIIYKGEIDNVYNLGEREFYIPINSDSSLGFKILEIAFIKASILNRIGVKGFGRKELSSLYNDDYSGTIEEEKQDEFTKIKSQYSEYNDFVLSEELIKELEAGRSLHTIALLLGEKNINYIYLETKRLEKIADLQKDGMTSVFLHSLEKDNNNNKKKYSIDVGDAFILSNDIKIDKGHGYSLERSYIDKNGERIFVIINPWNTGKKILLTLSEVKEVFSRVGIGRIDINTIFSDSNSDSPTPPSHRGSLD